LGDEEFFWFFFTSASLLLAFVLLCVSSVTVVMELAPAHGGSVAERQPEFVS
tara:strand:+ start:2396 stop:2551 length:156 start_codon:yes stop_codon:yes gene_type:complete